LIDLKKLINRHDDITIEMKKHTSAASIPVALNELAETGQLQPGQTIACIGFGGGLTWGGMIVEYKK
jgi:3-oxoacyl-[acyl-carrier-protein] synthase III